MIKCFRSHPRRLCAALCVLLGFATFAGSFAEVAETAAKTERPLGETLRVGWFSQPGYMEMDGSGQAGGYVYDYLQTIAQQTGWTYRWVQGDYATLREHLEAGELDLLGLQFAQTTQPQHFLLSDQTAGTYHSTLFAAVDSPLCENDYPAFQGIRVGSVFNSSDEVAFLALCRDKGITVTLAHYDTLNAIEAAVQKGEVDAGITGAYLETNSFRVLASFALRDFFFAVATDKPDVLRKLNNAMTEIQISNPNIRQQLEEKYNRETSEYFTLTIAEKAYFAAHPVLTVAYGKPWEPFLLLQDNQPPTGVAPRILHHLEELVGTRLQYVPLTSADQYDVLCGIPQENTAYGLTQLKRSDPFLALPMMLITRDGNTAADTIAVDEGFQSEGQAANPILRRAKPIYYPGAHLCLDAVLDGECQAALLNSFETGSLLRKTRYKSLVAKRLEGVNIEACFGVRQDSEPQLLSTLNKVIHHMGDAEINGFIIASTLDNDSISLLTIADRMPLDVVIAIVIIALLLLILLILVIIRDIRVRKERARATEIVAFLDYANRINDDVWELDVQTRKRWRYHIENNNVVRTPIQPLTQAVIERYVHPDDVNELNKQIKDTTSEAFVKSQKRDRMECRLMIGGAYRWTRIVFQSMLPSKQHPMCMMVYIMDADETVRAEEQKNLQLKDALALAQSASNAKSDFTAYISHEIRSPLNAVLGFLNIAKNSIGQPERLQDCFIKSEYAANHLLALVNDVLDMGSIASGKLQIAHESFDLQALMDTLASIYNAQARLRGILYTVESDDLPERYLIGDDLRVKQVIVNLLSNAMKFTPRQGCVTLSERQIPDGAGHVRMRFCVRDTGVGMSEEFRRQLFNAYTQQDASIARHFGGSGLGLTITKNLVSMMNGEITVQSVVGKGTTFIVEIPFDIDTDKKEQAASKPDSNLCFVNKRLLLVEDNDMNMEVASELLKQEGGFKIDSVNNGREAVELFTQNPAGTYDAILMDIRMPVMDGYEATRTIRASGHPDAAHIPIIAMTADAFAEDVRQAMEAGMNDHIAKPIDIRRVLVTLATAFDAISKP